MIRRLAPAPTRPARGARRAGWFAALGLAWAAAAAGAPPAPGPFTEITGDVIGYDSTTTETVVQGHARVRDGNNIYTADEIRYNRVAEVITARGHVVFSRGSERLLAASFVYQRRDGTFVAQDVRIGRPPYYISGTWAEGTPKQVTIHHAIVSYDEPGRWAPTIKADSVIYSPDHFLRLGYSRVGVGAAQFLPIPRVTQNLVGGAPVFSYMTGSVGYRSNLGATADLGLRLPVLPDLKVGGDVGIYTSRGLMYGPALQYESPLGPEVLDGYLRSGFISDYGAGDEADILGNPLPRDRGYVEWVHQEQVTDNLTLDGQFNWWSDSEMLRDFDPKQFYPVQEPDSYLESVYTMPDALVDAFTRIQPDTFEPVQERLPDVGYDLLPTAIGGGFYERFSADASKLVERPVGGGPELADVRLDTFYGLSRPLSTADWYSLTPVVGGRITNYSDTLGAPETGGVTRVLGEVGFDALMHANGVFDYQNPLWDINGLRQLLTPLLSYRYIPAADTGLDRIPQIDVPTFSPYLQPLELGDLRYIDQLHPENTLRIGLDNTVQTRDPTYGSRDLLTFDTTDDIYFQRQPGRDFSDLQNELSLTPAPWISFNADNIVNPQTFTLREIDAGIDLLDAAVWNLRLASDFLRHEDDDYLLDFSMRMNEQFRSHVVVEYGARQFRLNQVSYALEQNLSNIWSVRYVLTYNSAPNISDHGFRFNVEADILKF